MRHFRRIHGMSLAIALVVAGCATGPGSSTRSGDGYPVYSGEVQRSSVGSVERIELVGKGAGSNVAGTVIGGIVGGLIGSQVGGGSGRTAATIAGAAGGAVAGNVIEGRRRTDNEAFRVTVRLDDGTVRQIMQDDLRDLRTGDRVRVDGDRILRM